MNDELDMKALRCVLVGINKTGYQCLNPAKMSMINARNWSFMKEESVQQFWLMQAACVGCTSGAFHDKERRSWDLRLPCITDRAEDSFPVSTPFDFNHVLGPSSNTRKASFPYRAAVEGLNLWSGHMRWQQKSSLHHLQDSRYNDSLNF